MSRCKRSLCKCTLQIYPYSGKDLVVQPDAMQKSKWRSCIARYLWVQIIDSNRVFLFSFPSVYSVSCWTLCVLPVLSAPLFGTDLWWLICLNNSVINAVTHCLPVQGLLCKSRPKEGTWEEVEVGGYCGAHGHRYCMAQEGNSCAF